MDIYSLVKAAYPRINAFIRETPLEYSYHLSKLCDCNVYLKLENQQVTGSFKARGALNKVLSLSRKEKEKGIIAASTGNHAAGVAYSLSIAGASGEIYMPENVSDLKTRNLKQYKAVTIKNFGKDSVESENIALKESRKNDKVYISPYNDELVIAGQGTIAVELVSQIPELTDVLVPVGGGGLIAGIAAYLKNAKPDTKIIGCQPENSAVMYHSIKAGKILDMESQPTISDGTAGGIEEGSITFPACQQFVDDYYLLTEEEILAALRTLLEHHQILAEGAAGLSVAGLLKNKDDFKGRNVVLIICGNKISMELLQRVLA
ncbi:MAG: threonine/serine dehydratase [Bacteroidota bacterium]